MAQIYIFQFQNVFVQNKKSQLNDAYPPSSLIWLPAHPPFASNLNGPFNSSKEEFKKRQDAVWNCDAWQDPKAEEQIKNHRSWIFFSIGWFVDR